MEKERRTSERQAEEWDDWKKKRKEEKNQAGSRV